MRGRRGGGAWVSRWGREEGDMAVGPGRKDCAPCNLSGEQRAGILHSWGDSSASVMACEVVAMGTAREWRMSAS